MKNSLKITGVILGLLAIVALLIIGAFYLSQWNCGIFLMCVSIFAGILLFCLVVNRSKEIYGIPTVGSWISGSMFLSSFGVLIPIWIFNVETIWLGYTADALIILGVLFYAIGEIVRLKR